MTVNFPIVLTLPGPVTGEAEAIRALVGDGAFVHVRKPGLEGKALRRYLFTLTAVADPACLSLHHHGAEALEYGFHGLHLRPAAWETVRAERRYDGLTKSVSCHRWEETEAFPEADYVFLSPVFDSISKAGYKAAFDLERLSEKLKSSLRRTPVVALGGIKCGNIRRVREAGFDGAAVLGAVWAVGGGGIDADKTLANYRELRLRWEGKPVR